MLRETTRERVEADASQAEAILHAIAVCAASRRGAIVEGDEGKGAGTANNPAALTDQSLRWELTPLGQTCAALWDAGSPGLAARVGVWLTAVLRLLGRYAEAAACLQLSNETDADVEDAIGHKDLASAYSNLALIQQDLGDLAGARVSMEKAIAIAEKHLGAEHPHLATMRSNLAMIQQDQGDLAKARGSMEKAIEIQSKHFPPDHPTFATSYSNLATIQQDQGDLAGARVSMEKAIAIAEKHLGAEHPNLATMRSNLAMIQKDQGDLYKSEGEFAKAKSELAGARISMEKAIAIETKHYQPDHPTLAISYNNLAHICIDEGKIPEAVALWRKCHSIRLKALGPDHPGTKHVAAMLRKYDPPGP